MSNKTTTLRQEFNNTFELESEGCLECGGFELIDKREIRYPKGKYHCDYDLDKITDWWLEKFNSHSTELLRKIEGLKNSKKMRENSLISPLESYRIDDQEYGFNQALNEVINIINQEK